MFRRGWLKLVCLGPMVALFLALAVSTSTSQPSATHCDAAYCYVQRCEPGPADCHFVTERVCHPTTKQECTTQNVRKCHTVPDQVCSPHTVNECKSVRKRVCTPGYSPSNPRGNPRIASADDATSPDAVGEGAQQVASARRQRLMRRAYYPHRRPAPQNLTKHNQQQRPNTTLVTRPGNAQNNQQPNTPSQQCYWKNEKVCAPVAKQECRSVSKEVCNYQPERSCHNRQVQECRDERRQVCQPGPQRCYPQQVQRPCPAPQYWTRQGCETRPGVPPLPGPEIYREPKVTKSDPPPIDTVAPPPGPTIYREIAPDKTERFTPPKTTELDPAPLPPPPDIREKAPEPAQSNSAPPSTVRNDHRTDPRTQGPVIDFKIGGRSWRIELDPVPIATGAGLALLLSLLALWPKPKDIPTDADQLTRLGIECRAEPDLGEQTVTHLEKPPAGPRITVRATPGTRRYGVQMHPR